MVADHYVQSDNAKYSLSSQHIEQVAQSSFVQELGSDSTGCVFDETEAVFHGPTLTIHAEDAHGALFICDRPIGEEQSRVQRGAGQTNLNYNESTSVNLNWKQEDQASVSTL